MSDGYPGWLHCEPSIGYHGGDGDMYESTASKESKGTGKTFAEGDTIGCGINWDKGSVYYTLNGEWVGKYNTKAD